MGKFLAEQFLSGLTGSYVKRADPWREFLCTLGTAIGQFAELVNGLSRDLAL
jgi:hypothetical protein